jgi:HSP20 family protein
MANTLIPRRISRLPMMLWREPFMALRDELSGFRSRFFEDEDEGWLTGIMKPSFDMAETDAAIEVKMDVPGVDAKDIDIQVNDNLLTISGERKDEKEEKGKTFHRVERRYGSFSRSITLPCIVNENKVSAEYQEGVLKVTLPKTEESKAHKIKVKEGK